MSVVHYRPAISIIMPFEPKMSPKTELAHLLKLTINEVEKEVQEKYPGELSELVMNKLRQLAKQLNYHTHKKSIAIYVSPVFEKVLYLDIPVEAKIIVDESFEIRDLVYAKKQVQSYLVLLLSGKESRIFLGNTESFVRILSDKPESVHAYVNDPPERVANFSDVQDRREIITEKFLQHIDHSLNNILSAYPLPLFVCGVKKLTGHFKKISKHGSSVVEYINGNFEEATIPELKKVIEPHITDWKKVKQKELLNTLNDAAGQKKLAIGIHEVWREAHKNKGRLLVVEKDFMYPAEQSAGGAEIEPLNESYNKFSYIRDAVDDIIEKVLEHGGDVAFTDNGRMAGYKQIAMVLFY